MIGQASDVSFTLPKGRSVRVSATIASQAAACLLQPALMGVAGPSVAEAAAASLFTHLDPTVRKVLICICCISKSGTEFPVHRKFSGCFVLRDRVLCCCVVLLVLLCFCAVCAVVLLLCSSFTTCRMCVLECICVGQGGGLAVL